MNDYIQYTKILPSIPENSVTSSSRDTLVESLFFTDDYVIKFELGRTQ